ncbi:unnamed protein product [Paramecium primaurelia]|uniref:Uncharacterized protein n=1 Tax=Paramecium primaurelia TaxID=5886 RepID=A0A8S1LZS2_PARPR|nr:unnamed protein product [Paramecium primaurelia]
MNTNSYSSPLICIHLFLRGEFPPFPGSPIKQQNFSTFCQWKRSCLWKRSSK